MRLNLRSDSASKYLPHQFTFSEAFQKFYIVINLETGYKNAKTNPRDQGIPFHCSPKGCLLCQNQEEQGEHQIQGFIFTEHMILIVLF